MADMKYYYRRARRVNSDMLVRESAYAVDSYTTSDFALRPSDNRHADHEKDPSGAL